jgi:UrcA family protein
MQKARVTFAVAIACGLCTYEVGAKEHDVTAAVRVSPQGLDLSQPVDAKKFYRQLQRAARTVCSSGNRVGLVPLEDPRACYEESLGRAIRSAHLFMLTTAYLATHTPQQAAACGISLSPTEVTAR